MIFISTNERNKLFSLFGLFQEQLLESLKALTFALIDARGTARAYATKRDGEAL
jgi:hypothetical protein